MPPIADRDHFARTKATALFPQATEPQIEKVVKLFRTNFSAGYSPNPQEWDEETEGIGSGATGEEYVAYLGECVTHEKPDPTKLPEEKFWKAKHKCLTM